MLQLLKVISDEVDEVFDEDTKVHHSWYIHYVVTMDWERDPPIRGKAIHPKYSLWEMDDRGSGALLAETQGSSPAQCRRLMDICSKLGRHVEYGEHGTNPHGPREVYFQQLETLANPSLPADGKTDPDTNAKREWALETLREAKAGLVP